MRRVIDREAFRKMLLDGVKLAPASLYESQDVFVDFGNGLIKPYRDVTYEPKHHHRAIKPPK